MYGDVETKDDYIGAMIQSDNLNFFSLIKDYLGL